ncbi:MAG TPA: cytochrome c biogenesis protein CcsA [Tepidisphaeraceae bacterium]|nr:cytochrome c biogenesis protein CcsA [Tepidisphaeraceae bacterium]
MPSVGQIIVIAVSIVLFLIGGLISLSRLKFERAWSRIAAKACMWSGMTAALVGLVWHSMARQNWQPLEDNFDALIWLALALAGFVMYVQRTRPLGGLDWFIMPVVILLLIGAVVIGRTNPQAYDVHRWWTRIHLAGAFGGAAFFAVAAAGGAMYLVTNYRLRHKVALAGPSMGSLERLEHLMLVAVTLGFALLTLAAITGFAEIQLGHSPAPLAKIILSAAVWLVYAVVLHSPINPRFRGRRAAMLSIVGFALMAGTVVAVLLMPSGA